MKRISIGLLVFSYFLCIISCGNDDSNNFNVEGTWILETYSITDCPEFNIELIEIEADGNGCYVSEAGGNIFSQCITYTLENDGIGTVQSTQSEISDTSKISYTVDENNDVVIICTDIECDTLSIQDNVLSLPIVDENCNRTLRFIKK